jgi:homoserine kinase
MNVITMNPIEMEKIAPKRIAADSFGIKVPASIANLGPGFDTLAVAVQLYLSLRVRKIPGRGQLQFRFIDHELRGENCIERGYRALAGEEFDQLPSLSVEVRSEIPMCAGLGSSAAATVAGLRLYEAITGRVPLQMLLNAACVLEAHPDNAAASLLGGLTLSCQLPDGLVQARRFTWPESLGFVVLTPEVSVTTAESRAVLPECISRADAVFNLQRLALLLQSLHSGDFSLLKHALRDRVHQPARQKIVPGLAQALELEHPDLLGICLSGSGPSIVAIAERNHGEIAELLGSVYQRCGIGYRIRTLQTHQEPHDNVRLFRSGLLCC